ncbi:Predicted nucleic acid-binding protein, contains PIN domain [Burkholderiales bacterium 8X]|nr:Predicted nucleic acid-binding protein, contains PIN domain [Burkholderiales bacterium 8X]
MSGSPRAPGAVVIDTNIALDLLVFGDPAAGELADALDRRDIRWIASHAMRDELIRVLGYAAVARHLHRSDRSPDEVLAAFDLRTAPLLATPPRATNCRCSDPDDQVFVDLAVAHGAWLLSKDRAVLALRKRLDVQGARVLRSWPDAAPGRR